MYSKFHGDRGDISYKWRERERERERERFLEKNCESRIDSM
jgi:hypothetical protein